MWAELKAGNATLHFAEGSAGARAAPAVASILEKALPALAPLAGGALRALDVYLSDPFPDPAADGQLVTRGTLLYPRHNQIWMAVTDEAPPEPIGRSLALLAGRSLPLADALPMLFEGYGLFLSDVPDPDAALRGLELPPLDAAEGELATAMGLSLVRHLIARFGEDRLQAFLTNATPETLEAAAKAAFGAGMGEIDEAWRAGLAGAGGPISTRGFLALAFQQLKPYKRQQAEMFVYMLFGLAFAIVFPFAFRKLVDEALPQHDSGLVVTSLGLLAAAFVISLLADVRRAYLAGYVSSAVVRDIRTRMFAKLQTLDIGWFRGHQAGDVVARVINDVEMVERGLSQTLREGAFEAIRLVMSMAVLVVLNPLLALIVLAGIPAVGLVYRRMADGARTRSLDVQQGLGALTAVTGENYSAQPVVKAYGLESRERDRFDSAGNGLFKALVRLTLYSGLFGVSVELIATGLRIAVLGVGAALIFHGSLTIGGLVAFVLVMGQALAPVTVLTSIGQQLQASTGSLARLDEVLQAQAAVAETDGATAIGRLQRGIELRGVQFSYGGQQLALRGVDARIPVGAKVAFVGPSGSGKSTLLQLVMRLYDPDAGVVLFDGVDIRSATIDSVRGQIGVVFQDSFMFDVTLRENIELGRPGASPEQVEAAAQAAGLGEALEALPEGYDTMVGEGGVRLSGGQRQRVAIARALLRDPALLLLDEATSALDPRTERLVNEAFDRAAAGRTTIAVTHRLASVMHYDLIYVVADGLLAESGTHEQLLAHGGVYAELWREQAHGAAVPALDILAALTRIPLFGDVAPNQVEWLRERFAPIELQAGQTMTEADGLLLLTRGEATVLQPGLRGDQVPLARLRPGDTFGLGGVTGDPTGVLLRAEERVDALALSRDGLRALAQHLPAVAAVLERQASVPSDAAVRLAPTSGVFTIPPELLAARPLPETVVLPKVAP